MKRRIREQICLLTVLITVVILGGCDDAFEYSPYAANVNSSFKNTDKVNLQNLIIADSTQKDEIRFAVIADSHYNYHELNEAIMNINSQNVDFVIVNGDMADHGYLKEYELFHENMNKLVAPYMTVIGNHDYRSNGGDIYKDMFGDYNKSFVFNNNLFILFDDVFWESNKKPDMEWLENELEDSQQYDNTFVICHIPPYGEQFTDEYEEKYKELMIQYNVGLSIHGHIHRNEYGDYYGDGMTYLAVESIMDKEYSIITVTDSEINVDNIKY